MGKSVCSNAARSSRNGLLLSAVFVLSSCSVMTFWAQPSAGFLPKDSYQVSYDQAWDGVLELLGEERVGTVYQDKAKRRVTTGYFTGTRTGREVQNQSRWSYEIIFVPLGENRTRIEAKSKIEQYLKGWGYTYSWKDISNSPGVEKNVGKGLDAWLQEKLETKFRQRTIERRGQVSILFG